MAVALPAGHSRAAEKRSNGHRRRDGACHPIVKAKRLADLADACAAGPGSRVSAGLHRKALPHGAPPREPGPQLRCAVAAAAPLRRCPEKRASMLALVNLCGGQLPARQLLLACCSQPKLDVLSGPLHLRLASLKGKLARMPEPCTHLAPQQVLCLASALLEDATQPPDVLFFLISQACWTGLTSRRSWMICEMAGWPTCTQARQGHGRPPALPPLAVPGGRCRDAQGCCSPRSFLRPRSFTHAHPPPLLPACRGAYAVHQTAAGLQPEARAARVHSQRRRACRRRWPPLQPPKNQKPGVSALV